jgi:hypothetical protein
MEQGKEAMRKVRMVISRAKKMTSKVRRATCIATNE